MASAVSAPMVASKHVEASTTDSRPDLLKPNLGAATRSIAGSNGHSQARVNQQTTLHSAGEQTATDASRATSVDSARMGASTTASTTVAAFFPGVPGPVIGRGAKSASGSANSPLTSAASSVPASSVPAPAPAASVASDSTSSTGPAESRGGKGASARARPAKAPQSQQSNRGPYRCSFKCGRRFRTTFQLKQHERQHTGERPYVCRYIGCTRAFASLPSLTYHHSTHDRDAKSLMCAHCRKVCGTQAKLERHSSLKHPGMPVSSIIAGAAIKRPRDAPVTATTTSTSDPSGLAKRLRNAGPGFGGPAAWGASGASGPWAGSGGPMQMWGTPAAAWGTPQMGVHMGFNCANPSCHAIAREYQTQASLLEMYKGRVMQLEAMLASRTPASADVPAARSGAGASTSAASAFSSMGMVGAMGVGPAVSAATPTETASSMMHPALMGGGAAPGAWGYGMMAMPTAAAMGGFAPTESAAAPTR